MAKVAAGATKPDSWIRQLRRAGCYARQTNGQIIICRLPQRKQPKATPLLQRSRDAMRDLARAQRDVMALDATYARFLAYDTLLTWRDVLALMMTGQLVEIPGVLPAMSYPDLNMIGVTPGALLFRDEGAWIILPPGALGQVLTMGSEFPVWAEPQGGGGGAGVNKQAQQLSSDLVINPTPVPLTVVSGLTHTVGPFDADTLIFVSFSLWLDPGHVACTVALDGAAVYIVTAAALNDADGRELQTVAGYPVTVPGDGDTHTIDVVMRAIQTTAATTFKAGSFSTIVW